MILLGIVKFIVSVIAIISLLLLVSSTISSIVNPQIITAEDGQVREKNANFRIWMGLITSLFWSLVIVL